MDFLVSLLGFCTDAQKAGKIVINDDDASEMQLNAFEFRDYRTNLEPRKEKVLERVVNQWCAMLVKGKTMKINDFEEKVYLDKDMLNIEYSGELFPLKAISKMEMFKDTDDMMMDVPWGLDITFAFLKGDSSLRFNFTQERHRLNFALTVRILRTRDPTLDPGNECEIITNAEEDEEEEDEDKKKFGKVVAGERFNVEAEGIPIVFSVSEVKIIKKLVSTSRHTYLEFFIRYPRQDKFLYAKSGTTHIPQTVLQLEDASKHKKKKEEEEDDDKKKSEKAEEVLCTMKFDLKNVKLKVPKVPHTVFGRLMAKDDYFPTAIATFEVEIKKSHLQDRRQADAAELERRAKAAKKNRKKGKEVGEGMRTEPESLSIPVMSSWKFHDDEESSKVGTLNLYLLGYVLDKEKPKQEKKKKEEEEEEGQEEDEEAEGSEGGEDEQEEAEEGSAEGSGAGSEEEEEEEEEDS